MGLWTRFAGPKRPPLWAGILTSAGMIALMAYLRLGVAGKFALPIGMASRSSSWLSFVIVGCFG